jgi:riboflavin kinase/FMN adenylyltransferase
MTIGVFDGIHRGHLALLGKIISQASSYTPAVVTFRKNPKIILHPDEYEGDIMSLERKLDIFTGLGIGLTILIDFSGHFSKLGGKEFLDCLKTRGQLGYLAIGSNFRCGNKRETDASLIKTMNEAAGIRTEVVPPIMEGASQVSSSRIRSAIRSGSFNEAAALLGRNVEIDCFGLIGRRETGGTFFDTQGGGRVTPPPGKYPVVLYEADDPEGKKTEISVEEGGFLVPSPYNAQRVEFT